MSEIQKVQQVQKILINGEWTTPKQSLRRDIFNPATGALLATTHDCGKEDVDLAVGAARAAHKDWWKTPAIEKCQMMHEVARRLRKNERAISTLMTQETGKPLIESVDCIDWVAACFDYYAEIGRASRGQSLPPVAPHQVNFTIKEPFGVVAAIVPFNFPLLLMSWKVAPALMAGNTMVCKAPHQNPLSSFLMAECYSHLPAGVINVISGGAQTGEYLIEHPEVDLIAFTGSTETGRKIAASAGANLKKLNMELGGIDPFIVCEDVELDVAVKGVAWARLLNAGQVCTSSKRIYVVEKIYDSFVRELKAYVSSVKVGDPMDTSTDMGPMISYEALVKVTKQVSALKLEGARLEMGGEKLNSASFAKGHFFAPTIFSEVKHGGVATTEEIFGPVIAVIRARDVAHAIEMANDSKFGLGAIIFTKNLEYAMSAMENIKAGTFWINDPLTDNDAGPFGGMRSSGMGRELGEEGLDAFREPKHVHLEYKLQAKNFWFPYKDRPLPNH